MGRDLDAVVAIVPSGLVMVSVHGSGAAWISDGEPFRMTDRPIPAWKASAPVRVVAGALVSALDRRERVRSHARRPASCWALTGVQLWERAPAEARRTLAAHMISTECTARSHVLLDDPGDCVHVVVRGGAKLYRTNALGRRWVEAILVPGDVCGRITATPDRGLRERVALELLEPSSLGAIPRGVFEGVLREHGEFAFEVMQHVEDRARRFARRLEALAFKDVETRVAETLVAVAHAHDEPCAHGFAVDVRLSQQDLAELVGASRQMVNRVLGTLERRLLVQRVGRLICILHMDRLERFANAGVPVSTR